MNKLPKHFLLFLYMAFFVGFSACKRQKAITKTDVPAPTVDNTKALRDKISSLEHNYKWLRMRANVDYQSAEDQYAANTSLRIKKDELIWASVTVLIEAARLQITNDSAVLLNRLQKQYTVVKTADLQKLLAIEGLDVKALQKILLAQPPFGIREGSKLTNTENAYALSSENASYKEEMEIDAANLNLKKYRFQKSPTQYITVDYSNFTQVEGKNLPQKIEFNIASPEKIRITLDVTDYTFTETDDAPFSIPSNYTKTK